MSAALCTQDEFVEIWAAHGGDALKVADVLGTTWRNVLRRRRRIEMNTGARLAVTPPDARSAAAAAKYEVLSPRDHKARQQFEIDTGTIVVFSDAHFWPGVRTTAFRALLKIVADIKPKAVVCNGDAFDGASISRWPRIGWDSRPTVQDEIKACTIRLGEIEDAAGKAKMFWPLGNHDSRFETRLAAVAPEFQGVNGFNLKDRFPAWAPCWSLFVNGDTVIKHRWKGGIHATRNNTANAGRTFVTGHLHSLKVTPLSDYNGTRWGVDTGTLADPDGEQFVDYTEDSPKDWRSGFVVLTYHKGRLLWPEVCAVVDSKTAEFRGSVFTV